MIKKKRAGRKATSLLAASLMAAGAVTLLAPPAAFAAKYDDQVPFKIAYNAQLRGDAVQGGSSNIECDPAHPLSMAWENAPSTWPGGTPNGCSLSKTFDAVNNGGTFSNSNYEFTGQNAASVFTAKNFAAAPAAGMKNSSSDRIDLPPGAKVTKALLMWGGCLDGCTERAPWFDIGGQQAGLAPDRVKFRVPGGAWVQVQADNVLNEETFKNDPVPADEHGHFYTADADVTALVTAGGVFSVGDIQFKDDAPNTWGNWHLAIAYELPGEPLRQIIFDRGLVPIGYESPAEITVPAISFPDSGPFNPRVMIGAMDGDPETAPGNFGGDYFQINGQDVSQAPYRTSDANGDSNFFVSRVTDASGADVSGRLPAYPNTYGLDIIELASPAGITRATEGVTLSGQSVGEGIHTYFMAFIAEVNPSVLEVEKDDNRVDIAVGQETTYTITARNTGTGNEPGATIVDKLPANMQFVAASNGGTHANGVVTFNNVAIPAGGEVTRTVRAKVISASADGRLPNSVTIKGSGQKDPDCSAAADAKRCDTDVDLLHDLKIDKVLQEGKGAAGETTTWSVTVKNVGPGTARTVEVSDLAGEGFDASTVELSAASQGTVTGGDWAVGTLAPGATATVTVTVDVADDYDGKDKLVNTATVGDPANPQPNGEDCTVNTTVDADTDQCDEVTLSGAPALSVVKFSGTDPVAGDHDTDPAVVNPKQATKVTVRVTNTGGQALTDIVLADVTDDGEAVTGLDDCEIPASLAIGASFDCVASLPAIGFNETHADTVTVTAKGEDDTEVTGKDPWKAQTPAAPAAGLTVVKFSGTDPVAGDHDTDPAIVDPAKGTAVTVRVTNNGDQALTDLVLADVTDDGEAVTGLDKCELPDVLAVGESFDCVGELPAIGFNKTHTDTVTVTGTGEDDGTKVTGTDPWKAKTPEAPVAALSVVKFSGTDPVAGDHDTDPAVVDPKQATKVTVRVTNTGGQALTDITLEDVTDAGESVTGLDKCEIPASLAIGASFDCVGELPAIGFNETHGDTVTVTAKGEDDGTPVTGKDPWTAKTPEAPIGGLTVVKFSGTDPVAGDHDTDPAILDPKKATPITIKVTNSGDEALTKITVKDITNAGPALTGLDKCKVPATLAAGDSFTCAGVLAPLGFDVTHTDTVTVTGTGVESGNPVTGTDPWTGKTKPAPVKPAPPAQQPPAQPPAEPAADPSGPLADTGSSTAQVIAGIAGLTLLGGGAVALVGRRRSRSGSEAA